MRTIVLGLSLSLAVAGGAAYATLARRPVAPAPIAPLPIVPAPIAPAPADRATPEASPAPGGDLGRNGIKPFPPADGGPPRCWDGACTRVDCKQTPERREGEDLHAALDRHLREAHLEIPAALARFPGAKITRFDAAEGRVELTHEGKAVVLDLDATFKVVRVLESMKPDEIPASIVAKLEQRFSRHEAITAAWSVEGGGFRARFKHESRRCIVKENGGTPMRAMILVTCESVVLLDREGAFVEQREVRAGS